MIAEVFSWDALVAIGTLALAVFTAWLAWSTRALAQQTKEEIDASHRQLMESRRQTAAALRQVEFAEQQAKIAAGALKEASEQTQISRDLFASTQRPLMLDVPRRDTVELGQRPRSTNDVLPEELSHETSPLTNAQELSFPVRNVGAGLARLQFVLIGQGAELRETDAAWQPQHVPAGEASRIQLTFPPHHPFADRLRRCMELASPFEVWLHYSDQSETYRAVLHLRLVGHSALTGMPAHVDAVEHRVK